MSAFLQKPAATFRVSTFLSLLFQMFSKSAEEEAVTQITSLHLAQWLLGYLLADSP